MSKTILLPTIAACYRTENLGWHCINSLDKLGVAVFDRVKSPTIVEMVTHIFHVIFLPNQLKSHLSPYK
jgi:hypothetical protein